MLIGNPYPENDKYARNSIDLKSGAASPKTKTKYPKYRDLNVYVREKRRRPPISPKQISRTTPENFRPTTTERHTRASMYYLCIPPKLTTSEGYWTHEQQNIPTDTRVQRGTWGPRTRRSQRGVLWPACVSCPLQDPRAHPETQARTQGSSKPGAQNQKRGCSKNPSGEGKRSTPATLPMSTTQLSCRWSVPDAPLLSSQSLAGARARVGVTLGWGP